MTMDWISDKDCYKQRKMWIVETYSWSRTWRLSCPEMLATLSHKTCSVRTEAPRWYDLGGLDPGLCHAGLYRVGYFLAFSVQEDLAKVSEKGYCHVEFKFCF